LATDEEWRRWWARESQVLPAVVRRLLGDLTPGPDTARWLLGAKIPVSTAAGVVREWLTPPGATWVFVMTAPAAVRPVPGGALLGYAPPDADNPTRLVDLVLEAASTAAERETVAARLAEGSVAERAEARRCLLAGLPPHWPPGHPPIARGAVLAALRQLQEEGYQDLEALAVKAIEATTLTQKWQALEQAEKEDGRRGAW